MTLVDKIPGRERWIYVQPEFRSALTEAGLAQLDTLTSPSLGALVTAHRSSWVRHMQCGVYDFFIKTYDYPTWRDRVRGLGRNTCLGASRPRREMLALDWLKKNGFGTPQVLAVGEIRQCGWLRRACIATGSFPGQDLATLLPQATLATQQEILGQLKRTVQAMHLQGFRDGNLDLRNLLARAQEDGGWEIVKIDSPRFRLRPPGNTDDALAHKDWQRLHASLHELGLALP